jgi:hypothetical protein
MVNSVSLANSSAIYAFVRSCQHLATRSRIRCTSVKPTLSPIRAVVPGFTQCTSTWDSAPILTSQANPQHPAHGSSITHIDQAPLHTVKMGLCSISTWLKLQAANCGSSQSSLIQATAQPDTWWTIQARQHVEKAPYQGGSAILPILPSGAMPPGDGRLLS